jgi:hypothetical protein
MSREQTHTESESKLELFLENYGNFLGNCTNQNADLDDLIKDFTLSIPPPPPHSSNNKSLQ